MQREVLEVKITKEVKQENELLSVEDYLFSFYFSRPVWGRTHGDQRFHHKSRISRQVSERERMYALDYCSE